MLLSGSSDSTLKVWNAKTLKLMFDLSGHSDEVYAIDWSPTGEKAASGSKDHVLRIWRN
jgi:ribosome assembly protein 4